MPASAATLAIPHPVRSSWMTGFMTALVSALPVGDTEHGPFIEGRRSCPWPFLFENTTDTRSPGLSCIFLTSQGLVNKRVTTVQGFTCAFVCVTFMGVMAVLPLI